MKAESQISTIRLSQHLNTPWKIKHRYYLIRKALQKAF